MSAEMLSGAASAVSTAPSLGPSVNPALGNAGKGFDIGDRNMPSLNKDIFANTSPVTAFADFPDRAVFSKSVLTDTTPIAINNNLDLVNKSTPVPDAFTKAFEATTLPEENTVPESFIKAFTQKPIEPTVETMIFDSKQEIKPNSEVSIKESPRDLKLDPVFEDILKTEEVVEAKPQAIEVETPEVPMEKVLQAKPNLEPQPTELIRNEVKMAENVRTLLVETGIEEEEATQIAEESLSQSLLKKGLNTELTSEEEAAGVNEQDEEQKKKKKPDETLKEKEFVRDEVADSARAEDGEKAIERVFEKEANEVVSGQVIAENMNQRPSEKEVSEIALQFGQRDDGSYAEILKEMRGLSFESKKDAKDKLFNLIYEKPAVRKGDGRKVGQEDIRRVLDMKSFRNPVLDFLTESVSKSK